MHTHKFPGPEFFTSELQQTFKEEIHMKLIPYNLFQKIEDMGMLSKIPEPKIFQEKKTTDHYSS